MTTIAFIAENGSLFSGVSGLIEFFSIANIISRHLYKDSKTNLFKTSIVSTEKKVELCGGMKIVPDNHYNDIEDVDIIVVPPFLPNIEPLPGLKNDLYDFIFKMYEKGVLITSLCTGSFIPADMGLLNGRVATTNWKYASLFRRRFPGINLKPELILAEDGNLITTGAGSAFYNLGFYLAEKYGSARLSVECSKSLLINPGFKSQAAYSRLNAFKNHGDDIVLSAQKFMEENFSSGISIEKIAENSLISSRHFKRRFKKATGETPINYLQKLRVDEAKNLLEDKSMNIDEVTYAVGYENASAFRKIFKKYTGLTPGEYKNRFSRIF